MSHQKNKLFLALKITSLISLFLTSALFIPLAHAQNFQFEDPLGVGTADPITFIENLIFNVGTFLMTLFAAIAMVVILYAGIKLIIGGATSEAEIASAKRMLFWAVAGLLVIGGAATILVIVAQILGFNIAFIP
jgi:hypothetical protein